MANTNAHEVRARYEKRDALIAQLDRIVRMCGLDPDRDSFLVVGVVNQWSPERWRELACSVGKKPPSKETQTLVIDALLARGRNAV